MKEALNYWWMVLIKGILMILLSILIFANPSGTLLGLALYMGIVLLITGLLMIITAISTRKLDSDWGWKLTEGILELIFGFILLSNPAITAAVLPFVVGFWMLFYGIMLFVGSFSLKKAGDSNWWLGLIGGILTALFGYIIMTDFMSGMIAITVWFGIGFMVFGLVNVFRSFSMKNLKAAVD